MRSFPHALLRPFNLQLFAEERSEPATPRKRQKTREEGRTAKSQDLGAAVVILGGLGMIFILFRWWFAWIANLVETCLLFMAGDQIGREGWISLLGREALKTFFYVWLPLGFVGGLFGLGINIYQVGFFIASKPLIPDFKRMNPISGMKKIISLRSLVELSKGIVKAGLLLLMVYAALRNELEGMSHAIAFPLIQGVPIVVETIWWLALKMALLLLVLGIFDYVYQRWEFERSIKMSKKEIKDEYKQMEGDPKIKQKIRQRQREMARQRMMSEVPKADVVVTNPTTYAVALQYEREIMDAPVLLAKGRGVIARRIREIAEEHKIPIVENPPLARSLYDIAEIGFEIPESFYKAVAEVLAFVYKMRKK